MFKQIDKQKEINSRAVTNSVAQKKGDGKQGIVIVDNRAQATTQRMYNNLASQRTSEPATESQVANLKTVSHVNGCGCSTCAGTRQLKVKLPNQSTSIFKPFSQSTEVKQLCPHNHPEHVGVPVCPYGLKDPNFRIPPKHVKKKGGGNAQTTVASSSVMEHAQQELSDGRAQVVSTTANKGNDIEVAIDRQHRHKSTSAKQRNFYVHKRSNQFEGVKGKSHDFFLKTGEPSESESSGSESDSDSGE